MITLAQIEDVRGALEAGLAAAMAIALAGADPNALAQYTRATQPQLQKERPRFEIVVAIGAVTGRRRAFPTANPPYTRFDRWNFSVKFRVITSVQPDNLALHPQMVAAVRGFASTAAQNSWTDLVNFPLHFMDERLRDAGSPSSQRPQDETTELNFTGQVQVRESAWLQLTG